MYSKKLKSGDLPDAQQRACLVNLNFTNGAVVLLVQVVQDAGAANCKYNKQQSNH